MKFKQLITKLLLFWQSLSTFKILLDIVTILTGNNFILKQRNKVFLLRQCMYMTKQPIVLSALLSTKGRHWRRNVLQQKTTTGADYDIGAFGKWLHGIKNFRKFIFFEKSLQKQIANKNVLTAVYAVNLVIVFAVFIYFTIPLNLGSFCALFFAVS